MGKGFRYGLLLLALVAVLYGVIHAHAGPGTAHMTAVTSQGAVPHHAITQEGKTTAHPGTGNVTQPAKAPAASTVNGNVVVSVSPKVPASRNTSTRAQDPVNRASAQTNPPQAPTTQTRQTQQSTSKGVSSVAAAVADSGHTFTIDVHDGYDRHPAYDKKVTVPIVKGKSLMWYMHQYFTVTTTYGDGFVTSINGIKSLWTGVPITQRKPVDWFLTIDGVSPPVGAAVIHPRAGDTDVWDFHQWDPNTGRG